MKNSLTLLSLAIVLCLSSFTNVGIGKKHKTITRTTETVNGQELERTVILLDGNTSREDVIEACSFLARENVQLTFNELVIGKSFLGILGKSRIRKVDGQIALSNGVVGQFKGGGPTSFKVIKIQYAVNKTTRASTVEMVESID